MGPKNHVLDGDADNPRARGKFLEEMGRRNVTYRDNAASAMQKKHSSDAASFQIILGFLVNVIIRNCFG